VLTTRDLAVYAAVVGTISGVWSVAWSVYSGVLRDRARIKLVVYPSEAWDANFNHAEAAISFAIYNRGRRPIHISDLVRVKSGITGVRELSMVLQRMLKADDAGILDEGQGRTFHLGGDGTLKPGDLSLKRWYLVDQAGRVFPLRERYRQRLEAFVFWPIRKVRTYRHKEPAA
jgi:hypothetical protein